LATEAIQPGINFSKTKMARRTKKIKRSLSKKETVKPAEDWKIFSGTSFKLMKTKKTSGEKNFRFNLSLIILMAVLQASLFMLLLTLISVQTAKGQNMNFSVASAANGAKKMIKPATSQKLADPNIDFDLAIPAQLGEWLYKTGYVKSPVDDKMSDQYVRIYLPNAGKAGSRNFEDMTSAFLTIRKFTTDEWKKLDKGCQNKDSLFCEAAGTKIAEKDGSVYAYTKISSCPSGMESKCGLIEKIIGGFSLK
jgi:hypothetical protein